MNAVLFAIPRMSGWLAHWQFHPRAARPWWTDVRGMRLVDYESSTETDTMAAVGVAEQIDPPTRPPDGPPQSLRGWPEAHGAGMLPHRRGPMIGHR